MRDLLSKNSENTNLMILEDANKNIFVSDLTEKYVYSLSDIEKLIIEGKNK